MLGAANIVAGLLAVLGVLAGIAGIGFYLAQRKRARARPVQRRLPRQWPLNPRPLANTAERRVWHWLRQVFPDHQVLPKLPLTRFTMPRDPNQGSEWFDLLSSAYCSFTLCDDQARVIGCVDVSGTRSITRDNRQLKHTLLNQCGIAYWVLAPDALPEPHAIRADFLGNGGEDSRAMATDQAHLDSVRAQLHEALDRNREQRRSHFAELDSNLTPWPQPDSFLGSLEPRTGKAR